MLPKEERMESSASKSFIRSFIYLFSPGVDLEPGLSETHQLSSLWVIHSFLHSFINSFSPGIVLKAKFFEAHQLTSDLVFHSLVHTWCRPWSYAHRSISADQRPSHSFDRSIIHSFSPGVIFEAGLDALHGRVQEPIQGADGGAHQQTSIWRQRLC